MESPLTAKKETIIETGKGYHIKDECLKMILELENGKDNEIY